MIALGLWAGTGGTTAVDSELASQSADSTADTPGMIHQMVDDIATGGIARADGLVVQLDARGRVVAMSDAGLALLGWAREELIGRDWFETCLPTEVQVAVRSGFALIVAGELEPMAYYTNEVVTRDGRNVPVAWSNTLLREGDRVVGTLSLGRVAEAMDAASADALRAARYEQLFDTTPVGVIAVARDGTVGLANARAAALLGRPVEQLQGLALAELVTPGHPQAAVTAVLGTTAGGHTHLELPLVRPGAEPLWVRCEVSAGVDPVTDGEVLRLGLVDASVERQDREALSRLAQELVESNTELRRFADVLTHDLKGPLQALVGRLDLMQIRSGMSPEARQDAARALEAAMNLNSLIEDLRDSWAQPAVDDAAASASEAFDEAVRELDLVLAEAGASVTRGELPRVRAGRERLVQVFRNLLGNSAKYRGEAPLEIEASAWQTDQGWAIRVSDNGQGFDDTVAERIFDQGERLAEHAHIGGQGLGLALCRRLLAIDGALIQARGEPGQGAAFTLSLQEAGL